MTEILFYSTLVLNFAGFIFAGVYLWINISGKLTDLADRSLNAIKITKVSMITSIVFSFLTCLLTESKKISEAISRSALLYSIMAITWLVVIVACGITMLVIVISKNHYNSATSCAIKKLFKISLPGVIVCLILTWLFS